MWETVEMYFLLLQIRPQTGLLALKMNHLRQNVANIISRLPKQVTKVAGICFE